MPEGQPCRTIEPFDEYVEGFFVLQIQILRSTPNHVPLRWIVIDS
jgi:hypothetical protein